jgi:L-fucose isomerase-like protein
MDNLPAVNLGLVAVSRDCFPRELSRERRARVAAACERRGVPVIEIGILVENERDAVAALEEMRRKNVNALAVYLGNFGPEGPATLLAQRFPGPAMFAAAAEESGADLVRGRGDAYCGLLSASYSAGLRRLRPYIPECPVGDPEEVAAMLAGFVPVARTVMGVRNLKILSFGPRPADFFTCHAPLQPLFDLGVEVTENSELDLLDLVRSDAGDPAVADIARDMATELGMGAERSSEPPAADDSSRDLLEKLARFERALDTLARAGAGASSFVAFANRCWPAFEKDFGHVPCYVNARLAARGIPVACEADIYGALSEYMCLCASALPPGLLDINNTVPPDMHSENRAAIGDYALTDLWMGFHCGNTPQTHLVSGKLGYQLIMRRLLEPDGEPDVTRGTLEGRIRPGPVSLFRIQSTLAARTQAYVVNGEVLDIDPRSFGSIGVFAVKEMARFYRHVLIEKRFPHHAAVAFEQVGRTLFDACRMLGVDDVSFNRPAGAYYPTEYPY